MRVIVTGGTGFIGSHLVAALAARGDEPTVLTRDPSRARLPPGARAAAWDAAARGDWYGEVARADAVVHLAGEQAVGVRWTDAAKRRIVDSRVGSTRRIVEAMQQAARRPSTFVCASAVGYYGPRDGADTVDERAPAGDDFLARLTVAWEAAALEAAALDVRVVTPRLGIVLARGGGALQQMAAPFKLFAGGPIGSGEQVVSWVHVDDVVDILLACLDDTAISGAVNVVAPAPVTNAELSRAIGRVLHRPSFLRVPAAALRVRFGEGADPLLTGQRVLPRVMQERGYKWRYPALDAALEQALG